MKDTRQNYKNQIFNRMEAEKTTFKSKLFITCVSIGLLVFSSLLFDEYTAMGYNPTSFKHPDPISYNQIYRNMSSKHLENATIQKDNRTIQLSFTSVGNTKICQFSDKGQPKQIEFVAIIFSAVANFQSRANKRKDIDNQLEAIAKSKEPFRKVIFKYQFIIGQPKQRNQKIDKLLREERRKFGDVIQGNFLDTYKELPWKSVYMFHWIMTFCSGGAKLLLKMDDDVDFYPVNLFKDITSKLNEPGDWIYGRIFRGSQPYRNPGSKWYAPVSVYPKPVYPPYAVGFGYVIPVRTVPVMFSTICEVPTFYIDDVYITGICREKAGIKTISTPKICPFVRKNKQCIICH